MLPVPALPGSASRHDSDNLLVCLPHAVLSKAADIPDRVLHSLGHDTVTAVELLAVAVHVPAQNAGIHGGGNLGGAGSLGAVTDNAGGNCNGIYQGMGNFLKAASGQVGDPGTGAGAGADGSAVG